MLALSRLHILLSLTQYCVLWNEINKQAYNITVVLAQSWTRRWSSSSRSCTLQSSTTWTLTTSSTFCSRKESSEHKRCVTCSYRRTIRNNNVAICWRYSVTPNTHRLSSSCTSPWSMGLISSGWLIALTTSLTRPWPVYSNNRTSVNQRVIAPDESIWSIDGIYRIRRKSYVWVYPISKVRYLYYHKN